MSHQITVQSRANTSANSNKGLHLPPLPPSITSVTHPLSPTSTAASAIISSSWVRRLTWGNSPSCHLGTHTSPASRTACSKQTVPSLSGALWSPSPGDNSSGSRRSLSSPCWVALMRKIPRRGSKSVPSNSFTGASFCTYYQAFTV